VAVVVVAAAPPGLSFVASPLEASGSDGSGSCDSARRLPTSVRFLLVVMDDEKLLVRACFLPVILLGARAASDEFLLLSSSFRSVFLCTIAR
jgi:hypothetical protein